MPTGPDPGPIIDTHGSPQYFEPPPPPKEALLCDMDLSVRAYNCLAGWAKLAYVRDLTRMSKGEVKRIRGVGKVTLNEIVEALGDMGLRLRGEPAPAAPPTSPADYTYSIRQSRWEEVFDLALRGILAANPEGTIEGDVAGAANYADAALAEEDKRFKSNNEPEKEQT